MRDIFILSIIVGAVPLIFRKPFLGVLVWVWISIMNPHRLTYGFAYSFPLLDIIAAATILGFFISTERRALPKHPVVVLVLIFYAWTGFTTLVAVSYELAVPKWIAFSKIILFTVFIMLLTNTRVRVNALLGVIAVSLGYFSIKGGIFSVIGGGEYLVWGPPQSFLEDNNDMSLATLMIVPIMVYFSTQTDKLPWRLALYGFAALSVMTVFGTHSRGGLVAMAGTIGFMVMRSNKKVYGIIAALLVLFGAFVFMPDSWREKMGTIATYDEDSSAMSRILMWNYAINIANARPWGGSGFDANYYEPYQARYLSEDARQYKHLNFHSNYFEALGTHGYIGLTLYLALGIVALRSCTKIRKQVRGVGELRWAGELAGMLQISLVAYAINGLTINRATFDLYYMLLAVIAVTGVIVSERLKSTGQQQGAIPGEAWRLPSADPAQRPA